MSVIPATATKSLYLVFALLVLPAAPWVAHARDSVEEPRLACDALRALTITAKAIGLPSGGAVVSSATLRRAAATTGLEVEYCEVLGQILPVDPKAPGIEFEVNLPSVWNLKAVQFGGSGYDGSLVTGLGPTSMQVPGTADPLQQGYVTLGSDGGHHGSADFDGKFGLNDEALLNYGQQSIKKTHDAARVIVAARFGRAPTRWYFIGGSQGGHEALDAAARYSADFDGVVANYPAYDITLLHLGSLNVGDAVYRHGGAGWMNAAKVKLLTDAVYTACDALDGARDGIISNVAGCNAIFSIDTVRSRLRCQAGTDTGDACLSDAQIAAVQQIASPYRPGVEVAGMQEFGPWPLLEGGQFAAFSTFGSRRVPDNPPADSDALLYSVGAATVKYFITRDPSYNALAFEPLEWRPRLKQLAAIMDVSNVDLTPFRLKGGKIILTHGAIDDLISPHNTVAYYERHRQLQGAPAMDAFVRFYLIPGFGHGFGIFDATFDALGVLDEWVTHGRSPGTLIATDANPGKQRTRPMCVYPAWPRYTRAGPSLDKASSYTCVEPPL